MPVCEFREGRRRSLAAGAQPADGDDSLRGQVAAPDAHSGCRASARSNSWCCLAARARASASSSGCPQRACSLAAASWFIPARTCASMARNHARCGLSVRTIDRPTRHMILPPPNRPNGSGLDRHPVDRRVLEQLQLARNRTTATAPQPPQALGCGGEIAVGPIAERMGRALGLANSRRRQVVVEPRPRHQLHGIAATGAGVRGSANPRPTPHVDA
jgi:hypothetical protein